MIKSTSIFVYIPPRAIKKILENLNIGRRSRDRLKFRGDGELGQLSKITMVRSNNENHFAAENLISTDCVIKRCASSYEHELKKTFFRTSNINEIEREKERERENNDIKFLLVC